VRTGGGGPAGLRQRRQVGGKSERSSWGGGADLIRLRIGENFGLL